jgi:AbiV family abortive infection protein
VDLGAVKAAARRDLVACAVAAAGNAKALLDDAELLSLAGRRARASSLAVLAIEEVGKAVSMMVLSLIPEKLKGQARVGRMLEWHELKLAGGLLAALIPPGTALATALASMPRGELEQIMRKTELFTRDDDQLKRRGLYVDMDRSGRITQPSEVTEAQVSDQLFRARQAVSSASALLDPSAPARLASPPEEVTEFAEALVTALADAGPSRTPEAAADIMLQAVTKLADQQP